MKNNSIVAGFDDVAYIFGGHQPSIAYCFYAQPLPSRAWYCQTKGFSDDNKPLFADRVIDTFRLCVEEPRRLVFEDRLGVRQLMFEAIDNLEGVVRVTGLVDHSLRYAVAPS